MGYFAGNTKKDEEAEGTQGWFDSCSNPDLNATLQFSSLLSFSAWVILTFLDIRL